MLKDNLNFQRELRKYLIEVYGIDSLGFDGAYEIRNDEKSEVWTLMPPVVEVAKSDVKFNPTEGEIAYDGIFQINVPVTNDGAHRMYHARELNSKINVILVSNASEEHPFYAHPNQWKLVKVVDKVPPTKQEKKLYRREDCYALYRNFDVLGCGKPRGTSS